MRQIESLRPTTGEQLHRFVEVVIGARVPRRAIVKHNNAPFEYLSASFFENGYPDRRCDPGGGLDGLDGQPGGVVGGDGGYSGGVGGGKDLLVWANRGGGKTYLGAVATLVDLLFKPGVQVRILGGSLDQSSKMYGYLRQMLERPMLREVLVGEPTNRRVELINASAVEVLSQSHRSVRGQRVHKLRCDEVEEFKPEVWEAAQFVTKSGWCGQRWVRGSVEALSTMHRPFGLMSRLVERSGHSGHPHPVAGRGGGVREDEPRHGQGRSGNGMAMLRWCALDVIERCEPQRKCETCVLWADCQGRAKEAEGFIPVDDLVSQWQRSSCESWASEMMCGRPRRSECVYPGFDPTPGGLHVVVDRAGPGGGQEGGDTGGGASGGRASGTGGGSGGTVRGVPLLVAGMDFGLRSPLVVLWAGVRRDAPDGHGGAVDRAGPPSLSNRMDRVVELMDEYVGVGLTLDEHLDKIASRGLPVPAWIGVDPAGGQRNSHTGVTDIQLLRRRGYRVRSRRSAIREGIELIRRRLDHGTLKIHPRCGQLIEAVSMYHFDVDHPDRDQPVKDGPDHLCDALRYMIINLDHGAGTLRVRHY